MKKKSKICFFASMVSLLTAATAVCAHAEENQDQVSILCRNQFIISDQPAVIQEGRTLVPMRAIFEALGAEVTWNDDTQTVEGTKNGTTVSIRISEKAINVNGETRELDVPAQIIGDRTVVPVRAISEAFDCTVLWNQLKKCVIIIPKNQTPYRIDLIMNGETIASAHYNDSGLLDQITYVTGDYTKSRATEFGFAPLYINLNGNTYYDIFWRNTIDDDLRGLTEFSYTDGMLTTVRYDDQRTLEFSYNSDLTLSGYLYSDYQENRKVLKNSQWEPGQTLTYNALGLLTQINIQVSGGTGSFTYDDNGKMTSFGSSYYSAEFQYDGQKLSSAVYRYGEAPVTLHYQYSEE